MAGKTFVTAGDNRDDYNGFNPIYGADVDAFETLGDTVVGGQLSLQISGNAGADYIIGNTSVKAAGGEAGDTLYGGLGNDTLTATTVAASTAINIMDGGAGNDNITGGIWADSLVGGAGNDSIRTGANSAAAAIDTLFGGDGNDTLDASNNALGQSYLSGDAGDDLLLAGTIGTTMLGGAGNDKIVSGAGADSIFGGTGNDSINIAVKGNDSIFFAKGDGVDTIGGGLLAAGQLVSFTDAAVADITVGGSDSAYTIGISGTTDSIKIERSASGVADQAGTLKASGTAFTIANADFNGPNTGATYNSNVKLYAGHSTETDDLVKTTSGTGAGTFDLASSSFYSVEQFDNSANWFGGSKIRGTAGADTLTAAGAGVIGSTGDQLWGRAGNDKLVAGNANDTLWYGAGEGNDTIDAANKNDVINLYNVNSSAITYRLDGANLVISIAGQTDKLVVQGWTASKAKIATQDQTTPFNPVVPDGDTLVFAGGAGAQTIDLNDYSTANHINNAADTTGGSKFRGTAAANHLKATNAVAAGETGDQLWGRGGYDTLTAGAGIDTLWVGSGEGDKIVAAGFGVAAGNRDILKAYNSTLSNMSFSDNGTTYATFQDNGNQVKLTGVSGAALKVATSDFTGGKMVSISKNSAVAFISDVAGAGTVGYHYGSSGTDTLTLTAADVKQTLDLADSTKFVNIESIDNALNSEAGSKLRGTDGDNWLIASALGDQIWGRNGTDTLVGGAGADTFWAAAGEGSKTIQGYGTGADVLKLYAAKLTDLTFTDNGAKTTIGFGSGSDTLTLAGTFSTALSVQTTDQPAGKTVNIAAGTDGNVAYTAGAYHYGNNGKNTLLSTAVVATTFDLEDATKFNGIVNIDATGMVVNANGTVMRGTSGNNKLQASNNAGDGTALWGRAGDDTLVGGTAAASDVFWYGKDEGADVIQNFLVADDKVMLYTSGLTTADVAVAVSGNDVIFTIGTGTLKVTDGAKAGTSLMIGDTSGLIQMSDGNSYNVVSEGSGYVLKLK